jgi:hypothetical protein
MDLRIQHIFEEEMKGDASFMDNSPSSILEFLTGTKYSNLEMRKTWDSGIKHGIEIGLNRASVEGQIIELGNSEKTERQEEFYL